MARVSHSEKPVVLWFRQDLRLRDQAALAEAVATGRPVVPVYVLDDEESGSWKPGGASRWWLYGSLRSLAGDIEALGGALALRRGVAAIEIASVAREVGAGAVFAGSAVEPFARRAERDVATALGRGGIPLRLFRTFSLFAPDVPRTQGGGVFSVYTPFAKACLGRGDIGAPAPSPGRLKPAPAVRSDRIEDWALAPTAPDWAGGLREIWVPGESGARRRLAGFLGKALDDYGATRNLPSVDGTSMLSPHLHFGEISAGDVWRAATRAARGEGKGLETFLRELLWREFSIYLLWHHPELPTAPLRPVFAAMAWRDAAADLRAWRRGRTGVPIVDAGMRQLWHAGWLHNRARMIVASFLVKHLLIPWQQGEAWFWDTLVDADLAANSASWQWVAGCGADAAPYFRVFNPVLQGRRFDPDGAYVRRWVPELADLDVASIHAPWEAPAAELRRAGVRLGETYPEPIVDLARGRERALAAYRAIAARAA